MARLPKVGKQMDVTSFSEIRSETVSAEPSDGNDVERVLGDQHSYVEVRYDEEFAIAAQPEFDE